MALLSSFGIPSMLCVKILEFLFQHIAKPAFQCRFKWEKDSIAFWDNRSTWHLAVNDYHGERRLMHRITIDGTRLT